MFVHFKITCLSVFTLLTAIRTTLEGEITDSEHRTKAASEKVPDLWCYRCNTMIDGDHCRDLKENSSHFHVKCGDAERTCQVKRISMTTINKTGEIMGKPKLWLLQRNCTDSCDPGCIIIGERTKLYSCTTCCENSFCNSGSGSDQAFFIQIQSMVFIKAFSVFQFFKAFSVL